MEPLMDIPKNDEYKIRPQTQAEKDDNDNGESIPNYKIKLNLDSDDQDDLVEQIFIEFDALKAEREELKLTDKWEERDRQYDGELQDNQTLAFNLHLHQSKIKTDAITRAICEAFLDSQPMFDVSPRPESARNDGYEVAEKQAQFLDFAVDEEIKPESALSKIAKSAVTKFVGIGKLTWAYKREKRRREETYEGKIIPMGMVGDKIIAQNEGLEKFLAVYPDGMDKQKGIVKRLIEEKKVELVVEFKDTIDNNPKLKYVKVEDFYTRNGTDYWEGLRDEHLIAERVSFTYWELKKKEAAGEFENIEDLFNTDATSDNYSKDYMTKEYDVLEITTYYKANENDEEDIKVKVWVSEEKKVFLGAEVYPYYGFDTDYLPFYVKLNDGGFYGDCKSVLLDLRDSNIAQDVLLNLALHGTLVRNTITPIVKEGSEIEEQFQDHKFETGKPLVVDELTDDVNKAVGFVQYPNMDLNSTLALGERLRRDDGDVSRVSDLTTGAESSLDPSAPAAKTMALLQQSGIGIKDYIRTFLPTFNILAGMVLQLYYQMSQEDKAYKVIGKSTAITGGNPFRNISRDEMVVKTNIQARAAAFAFDKVNEKREALAAYQTVMADPFASQQPELLYKALKTLLDTFGDRWKAISDTSLMSPEALQQKMQQIAQQVMQQMVQKAKQQADATGVPPDPKGMMKVAPQAIQTAQAEAYNPQLKADREKAQGK